MTDFKQLFKNKLFLVGLVIKIIVACMFVGGLFIKGFLPFIDYFVNSGFHNPYDYFHGIGQNTAFPYSPVMLWLISLPYLIVASIKILWIKVFAIKSILLMADIAILRVLFKWFPVYKKKILIFYRLSPIFLFITYFYGQFDVIPTAFLLLTFYHIRDDRYFIAMILLGIGIATKTHIVLIVPFIFLYLFNKEVSIKELIKYLLVLAGTVCLLLSPYITSIGYNALVLHNTEQIKIFSLFLNYGFNNLAFFLIPGIYLVLILMFRFERRMNIDYLMVFSAIIFGLLVVLVPPQLGRYYWSIPFILYFYIKYSGIPKTNLMALYVSYFLFFLLSQKSDVMSIFGILHPKWENISLNGMMFAPEKGILVQNILFTILIITTIITVVGVYKIGFLKNKKYQDKQLLIGIGGDSGSGKSTLVSNIMGLFKENLITLVEGDDIHKWPRGDENRKKFTHLNPKSNNLHLDLIHAKILKSGDTVHRKHYDHATGKFTDPRKIHASKFLLFAGLHPFFLEHMRNVMDLKIFIKLDEQLRLHWKIVRDMQERGYTKERVQEQLKSREKDSIQYIKSQEQFADIVVSLSPFSGIKDIGNPKENIPLKLSIQLSNSYYLEPLTEALKKVTTLEIEHYINDDLTKQVFECSGTILPQEVKLVLKDIMPDYYVLTEKDPEMQSGINGIIQLFILYIKYNKLTGEA